VTLFAILTLFPEAVEAYTRASILGLAQAKGIVRIQLIDFRDFTRDRHRTVDDRPFGGGPGMVLKPGPIVECVEWLERRHGTFHKIVLCPTGEPFRQPRAEALACAERILLLCGRYEGFDARILSQLDFEELSVGDYVLAGGELAALSVTEAVARLIPGVLGDERSAQEDSFHADGGLDFPHFTRPRVYRGQEVPDVLLSGDHAAIARWREREAQRKTTLRRPELLRESAARRVPERSPDPLPVARADAPNTNQDPRTGNGA
jgi:tRNA (guanine37-N1)-methyltransferase